MFEKIDAKGDAAHPLYQWLKKNARGLLGSQRIKWNFTKFLLDGQGNIVERYAPVKKPQDLAKAIEERLFRGQGTCQYCSTPRSRLFLSRCRKLRLGILQLRAGRAARRGPGCCHADNGAHSDASR